MITWNFSAQVFKGYVGFNHRETSGNLKNPHKEGHGEKKRPGPNGGANEGRGRKRHRQLPVNSVNEIRRTSKGSYHGSSSQHHILQN